VKDHTGRAALEQGQLYLAALEFDRLRADISVPTTPGDLPDIVTAAQRLATLTDLIKNLSDEVLFRATDGDPGLNLAPVISAFTAAAVPAGRAVEHYTEALHQVSFLNQFADAPHAGDLRDARQAAFHVIQERLEYVRDNLQEVVGTLRGEADRLDGTPPRILAALSRSTRPANSIYRQPPDTDAPRQTTTRLAYTPAPRHAR
jgi:RecB family exonuclease